MANMRLEMIPVPVADIDIARSFYTDKVGFSMDDDVDVSEYSKRPSTFLPFSVPRGLRVVQMTPPGSECSILLVCNNPGIAMQPGTLKGLHLVVEDINTTRNELLENGVEVDEVAGLGGVLYAGFSDPDGNTWLLQQIPNRS